MKPLPLFKLFAASFLMLIFQGLLFPACFAAFAQQPFFRAHSLPQEFRSTSIHLLYQDKSHFIWLGTDEGLFRYDGVEYKQFLKPQAEGNQVSALFEDSGGTIWIGYKSGKIGRLVNGHFVDFEPEEGFPAVPVTGFAEGKENTLWFSTYGEGVYALKNGRLYNFNQDDGLNDDFAYSIAPATEGSVWAGTDGGVAICSFEQGKKRVKLLDNSRGLPDNMVTALAPAEAASMWLGMESKGVCRYEPQAKKFFSPVKAWGFGAVTAILPLKNKLWVGTESNGIVEVDLVSNAASLVPLSASTVPSRITSLLADHEGHVWVANGTQSIFSAKRTFSFLSQVGGAAIGSVQALWVSSGGTLWYSTGQDVFAISTSEKGEKKQENFSEGTPLAGRNVISLYEDRLGYLWFGTFDAGVFRLNLSNGQFRQYTEKEGLVNNNVLSIAGTGNEVWLATLGGVSQATISKEDANDLRFINFSSQSGLGSNYIYQVFIDSKKRVWFATDGKGVTLLQEGKFSNYAIADGQRTNVVYSVTEEADGGIWISTANAGIYRFNGKAFDPFVPHGGFRDLAITSLVGDQQGNVLVVSKKGADVLEPESGRMRYHGQESGITDIDPNLNAYAVDPAGSIWLGTQTGLIRYSSSLSGKQAEPVSRINQMLVFLNEVEPKELLRLGYKQNHVSFDYTGFWYHNPAALNYQLKLEGYDREWVSSRNHFVTYPSLPPGSYTFNVKASASNDFAGIEPVRYSFVIAPPFYNTSWFYVLCVFTGGGLLFLYVKKREQKLKKREQQKKEQVEFQFQTLKSQVNPHFLFNSFNTLIAVIEDDQERAVEYVEKLSDFYRNILLHRESNAIPLQEELRMMETYYFLQLKRYRSSFTLRIEVPECYQSWQIPPLSLQLLVENAVKHNIVSRETPLLVEILADNDYLVVKNNRQARQQYESSTGLGLQNIRSRFGLLTNKEVLVEETPASFAVYIPLLSPAK